MVDALTAQKGQSEAGTPAAQDLARPEQPEIAGLRELLGLAAPQAALPGLLEEDADVFDLVGRAAETLNAQRRGAGRPEGSHNRRNDELFEYLAARGYKMPDMRLMEIISADAIQLAIAVSSYMPGPVMVPPERVIEILRLQAKCAEAMMPYRLAKKQELKIEHNRRELHVMVAGTLSQAGIGQAQAFDLTNGAVVEIAGNSGASAAPVSPHAVSPDAQLHEDAKETGEGTAD